MTVVLACNPHAGHFRADRVARWQAVLEAQGHRVTYLDSLVYARDPRAHEADMVGIVGGDGTARIVVEALRRAALSPLLAIMPAGTVNLIAREIEASGTKAKDGAEEGQARTHYHGLIDGQAFLCCASVGPDSAIVARVTPVRKARWGKAAYVLAALAQIAHWPRPRLAVTVDGQPHEAEAVFVLKGHFYAGPWMLDPAARLDRADLRVLLLPRARRRDIARLALGALLGAGRERMPLESPAWRRFSAHSLTIASADEGPVHVQADGDIVGQTPVRIALAEAAIHFDARLPPQ
ncbi:MAG: diacylglycerol kinase family protein [Novosphingobium aromaticivorans]|nr:diacylglycerol kinase family protein [Novosphingobium aromaticivorans]